MNALTFSCCVATNQATLLLLSFVHHIKNYDRASHFQLQFEENTIRAYCIPWASIESEAATRLADVPGAASSPGACSLLIFRDRSLDSFGIRTIYNINFVAILKIVKARYASNTFPLHQFTSFW